MNLDTILGLCGVVAEAAVVVFAIRAKLFRITPVFCSYIVWGISVDISFYFINRYWSSESFRAYVVQMVVDSVFMFAVLVELEWAVLRPIRSSLPRQSILILALLVVAAGAIIWPLARFTLPHNINQADRVFVQLQQTVAALRVVFFVAMAGFSQLLSIGWRNRELQIATGLGFFSMCTLAISLIHAHQAAWLIQLNQPPVANPYYHVLDQIGAASYIGSLLYWVVSFAQREEERQEFTPQMRSFLLAVTGAARGTRMALADSPIGTPTKVRKP